MLAAALDTADPGDKIFVTYGDGADAFIFQVTDTIGQNFDETDGTARY